MRNGLEFQPQSTLNRSGLEMKQQTGSTKHAPVQLMIVLCTQSGVLSIILPIVTRGQQLRALASVWPLMHSSF